MRLTARRLAAAALLLGALAAPAWAPRLLRRADAFRIQRVEVSGMRLLAPHAVVAAAGLRAGENLWEDVSRWEAALRRHPAIADARVSRDLPHTLRIRIEEKRPVALVEDGTLRPATADGQLLPVDPARAPVDLPLLRLPRRTRTADSAPADSAARRALLAEAGRLTRLEPELIARVSELRPAGPGLLRVTLSRPHAELLLPAGADATRLRQLRAVLLDVERRLPAPADSAAPGTPVSVDLRYADQIVVRYPSAV